MALDSQACLWYYGNPESKQFTTQHLTLYVFPEWMANIFPAYQVVTKVRKQWVNKDLVAPLEAVFKDLLATGLYKELKTYDGGLNVRKKRELGDYSVHSWGLAMDFNAKTNPLGGKCTFSQAFLQVWRNHGFSCGADWAGRSDPMHMQLDSVAIKAYRAHQASQALQPLPTK